MTHGPIPDRIDHSDLNFEKIENLLISVLVYFSIVRYSVFDLIPYNNLQLIEGGLSVEMC